jgi:DNA-binding response OmpR family regulator
MGSLLLLTSSGDSTAEVLPALALLPHRVSVLPPEATALIDAPRADAALVDGRYDLAQARGLTRLIRATGIDMPLVLVLTEGGLAVVSDDWGMDDVVLHDAGPAEVEARLRLATGRLLQVRNSDLDRHSVISSGGLQIDEAAYTAKLEGRGLDLTFKEFELVKFLAQHPGRVFTRQQLLQEVWGYDYFGGTRTVDVHVRRLRAKLGTDHEQLIGTVRNVGYRFVTRPERSDRAGAATPPSEGAHGGSNGSETAEADDADAQTAGVRAGVRNSAPVRSSG